MSPVLWSPTGPQWKPVRGIFWRAVAWTNLQAAAKKATASFTSKTGYPVAIVATAKKPAAGMTAVMEPRAQIAATLAHKPLASLTGVMEPRGTFAAQLAKAVAFLQQKDLGQISAQTPKATASFTAKETERANIVALLNKATASMNAKQKQPGIIAATTLKPVAGLVGRAPVPPSVYYVGAGVHTSSRTPSGSVNIPSDPTNAVIVGIATLSTSNPPTVTATVGGVSMSQLAAFTNVFSFTSFGSTYHGAMWIYGLQNVAAGTGVAVAVTLSASTAMDIVGLVLQGVGSFGTAITNTASGNNPSQVVNLAANQMAFQLIDNSTSSGSSSYSANTQTNDDSNSFGSTSCVYNAQHGFPPAGGGNTTFGATCSNSPSTNGMLLLPINGV